MKIIVIVLTGIFFIIVGALAKSANMADKRMKEIMKHQNKALGGEADVG